LKARIASFRHAFRGLRTLVAGQVNARIHLAATVAVVAAGFAAGLSTLEWIAIVIAVSTVWCAEAINTALELLADRTAPERHPLVGAAKDVAAAGVLVAAICALIIGVLIFVPRIL